MVVGAFPAAKLGVLALKQISKPIANVLKHRAKQSPFFRKYICMPPAQFYNYIEVKTKMLALNLGKPTTVPKLTETMAIELGSNLLGEVVIFAIGAALLILEYQRQNRKEILKEQLLMQEKMELQAVLNELAFQAERQDTQIRELTRVIAELESKTWTPKILNDIVGKKKSSVQDKNEDNPLELLPDKKSKRVMKKSENDQKVTKETGNERSSILSRALDFLIDDLKLLNYSTTTDEQIIKSSNVLEKAVNDLFYDEYEIEQEDR